MCLLINTDLHKNNKPFVADKNIVVYKFLKYDMGCFYTPFQYFIVNFDKNGMFFYDNTEMEISNKKVYRGIHSYIKETYIPFFYGQADVLGYQEALFYAIIPAGSHYYIGVDNDIVSDNLIIFKHTQDINRFILKEKIDITRIDIIHK